MENQVLYINFITPLYTPLQRLTHIRLMQEFKQISDFVSLQSSIKPINDLQSGKNVI